MFHKRLIPFIAIAGCLILFSGCREQSKPEYITLGALLPLTGESSGEGLRALNGLQLAKNEINENGGIDGKLLDIIVLNDRGDKEYIVRQYEALMEKGVAAIIGSSYSDATMTLAAASESDGIPIISPTATNPQVTLGRPNVFRAVFTDDYQTEAMARFAFHSINARTALILRDTKEDGYGGLADFFRDYFQSFGGDATAFEFYNSPEEFAGILSKYTDNPPDIIYCPEDSKPAAHLAAAVHEMGLRTVVLGIDAWDSILTYMHTPEAMENVFFSAPFSFDDEDPSVARFVKDYFDTFSQMPLSGGAAAYTCVQIITEAIKTAGSVRHADIIKAMKENELESIMGFIKFNENNNPRSNVYIMQIKGGEYSTYEKITTDWGAYR